MWFGLHPKSLILMIRPDLLQASRLAAKIIKITIIALHELWIERCRIIHITMVDGIQIEERVELINEIEHVKMTMELNNVKFKNMSTEIISSLPTSTIKGLLFEYYALINDIQAYNSINERTIRYKNKINNHITEEGHVIREGILEKIELWKRDKDENEGNNFV